jgi:hypothetical protein
MESLVAQSAGDIYGLHAMQEFSSNSYCESTFVKEIDVLPIIELACIVGNSRTLSIPSF